MLKKIAFAAVVLALVICSPSAIASPPCPSNPHNLTNNTTADALQVMDNFNNILNCANTLLAPLAGPLFTGSVGIGNTVPGSLLDVGPLAYTSGATYKGDIIIARDGITGSASAGGLEFLNDNFGSGYGWKITPTDPDSDANQPLVFSSRTNSAAWSDRVAFTRAGYVGIGTLAPTYPLDVVGDIRTSQCLHYNNSMLGVCSSDALLKRAVAPFTLGLDVVVGLRPVNFNYNGLGGNPDDGIRQLGLIAQDVERVAPQLVGTLMVKIHPTDAKAGPVKTVDYAALTYILINSVKELKAENDRAAMELDQLRAQVAELRRRAGIRTARLARIGLGR